MRRHVPVERHSVSDAERLDRCQAGVSQPPHYLHVFQCQNKAKHTVGDYCLCGTHAKIARQWEAEGQLDSCARFYWSKS